MPLETRTAAINLTPPQDGSLTDDVYRYLIDNFALIRRNMLLLEALIVQLQVSAQGAMAQVTSAPPYPDITGAFQTIDFYDIAPIPARGCTVNPSTGEFTFEIAGNWLVLFLLNITHNESNSGRTTTLRLFDIPEAKVLGSAPLAIGRNTPGTSQTIFITNAITPTEVGDTFRMEIGGGDTLTAVEWNATSLGLFYQDQLGSLIDPTP